jgi:hypothetical protein
MNMNKFFNLIIPLTLPVSLVAHTQMRPAARRPLTNRVQVVSGTLEGRLTSR